MARLDPNVGDARASLQLYIARSTPNSVRAQANLFTALARQAADRRIEPEIIDVFSQPRRAIDNGIFVTPTLVILRSGRRSAVVGDLSNTEQLDVLLKEAEFVGSEPD
jgi:circadian clock protein KaiB